MVGNAIYCLKLIVADAADMISQMLLSRRGIACGDSLDDSLVLLHRGLDPAGESLGEVPDPCKVRTKVFDQCLDPGVMDLFKQDVVKL